MLGFIQLHPHLLPLAPAISTIVMQQPNLPNLLGTGTGKGGEFVEVTYALGLGLDGAGTESFNPQTSLVPIGPLALTPLQLIHILSSSLPCPPKLCLSFVIKITLWVIAKLLVAFNNEDNVPVRMLLNASPLVLPQFGPEPWFKHEPMRTGLRFSSKFKVHIELNATFSSGFSRRKRIVDPFEWV
jgi:hypothetical protein